MNVKYHGKIGQYFTDYSPYHSCLLNLGDNYTDADKVRLTISKWFSIRKLFLCTKNIITVKAFLEPVTNSAYGLSFKRRLRFNCACTFPGIMFAILKLLLNHNIQYLFVCAMRTSLGGSTLFLESLDTRTFVSRKPFLDCRTANKVFLRKILYTGMPIISIN